MKTLATVLLLLTDTNATAIAPQKGLASWYGTENSISSTGKRLKNDRPALAHRTLPIGSLVKVTDTNTKKSIVAVVEDRGPYIEGRIVDLNKTAAKQLGILKCGVIKVSIEKIR